MSEPNDAHEADTTGTDGAREADEPADLDYEQARDQLIEVVRGLEAGGLSLEESLALWEKGERLARLCERHLEGARERIEAALATVEDAPEDAEAGPSADGRPE
ncbi:exodeoxyribonuclease VII small subunit [Saccharomonospora saliphila]|uniref:exodeoxyribonuclease VII small subunit n=1 Tax=Saccharomonospora saliphila TaxID=369829 RepID=UPI00035F5939|nr:exodeoxyribonuclease VII small subunit [Saccharomonospora saliphila]